MRLLRRLTLRHNGEAFLDRWGLVHDRIGGFYLHHVAGPDPGLDLHDHPWAFVSLVLSGGYTELRAHVDLAVDCRRQRRRRWLSLAYTPLSMAHRISEARPGTWTLVLRGPTRRMWGFYPPGGWVPWTEYDYATRRPSAAEGNSIRGMP